MLSYEHATVCRCIIGLLHQMGPVRSFEALVKNKISIEEIPWDADVWVYLVWKGTSEQNKCTMFWNVRQ